MDQGVLENVKKNYRRQLLENLLDLSETEDLASCLRKITLKDVVYWISQAWDSVRASTIQKSWTQLTSFNNASSVYDEDDLLLLNELRAKLLNNKEASSSNVDTDKGEDEPSLTGLMRQLKGCEQVTDDDVRQWIASDDVEHESSIEEIVDATKRMEDDPDDCIVVAEHRISHQEGFAAFEKVLLYVEQQAEANPADVLLIKRWRDIASRKRRTR
ncbi:hypothetical protein CBL_11682 [Carabus blaptoides fortunei]